MVTQARWYNWIMSENNAIPADFFHTIGHPGVWTTTSAAHSRQNENGGVNRSASNASANNKIRISPGCPFATAIIIIMGNISVTQFLEIAPKKYETFHCQLAWLCDCNLIGDLMLKCIASVLLLVRQFKQRLHSISVTCVCCARWALIHSVRQLISSSRFTFLVFFFSLFSRRHEVRARRLLYSFIWKYFSKRNVCV